MAKLAKKYKNPRTEQVWEDLDAYRDFCRSYGYAFREEDLYNMRTYPFQQFNKYRNGKNFKDQWEIDLHKSYGRPAKPRRGKRQ